MIRSMGRSSTEFAVGLWASYSWWKFKSAKRYRVKSKPLPLLCPRATLFLTKEITTSWTSALRVSDFMLSLNFSAYQTSGSPQAPPWLSPTKQNLLLLPVGKLYTNLCKTYQIHCFEHRCIYFSHYIMSKHNNAFAFISLISTQLLKWYCVYLVNLWWLDVFPPIKNFQTPQMPVGI